MSTRNDSRPTVISFVSGKGGVGKTMLAVAAANELSHAQSTLVLDLDFFNRGLSGMFIQGQNVQRVKPPSFVEDTDSDRWWAQQITDNLYTVSFPDVTGFDTIDLEPQSLEKLADSLNLWIGYLCEVLHCKAVVLDCHGGPDALSFAAVRVADKTLLVSEPDRVTMYGTLHFLRTLRSLGVRDEHVHLVFNKIVDSVSPNFLWRLYKTFLKDYFDEKSLLAAFPLELYLTKSFENNPLVTEDYPQSMLTRKTQVMLVDLLGDRRSAIVPSRAKNVPGWLASYTRHFFGRPPKLLTVNFLAVMGFVLLLVLVGVEALSSVYEDGRSEVEREHSLAVGDLLRKSLNDESGKVLLEDQRWGEEEFWLNEISSRMLKDPMMMQEYLRWIIVPLFDIWEDDELQDIRKQQWFVELTEALSQITDQLLPEYQRLSGVIGTLSDVGESLKKVIFVWAALALSALIVFWTNYLDREGTVLFRRKRLLSATGLLGLQALLWVSVVVFLSGRAYAVIEEISEGDEGNLVFYSSILFAMMGIAAAIWIWQGYRGYRDLKYSDQWKSGLGRVIGAVIVISGLIFFGLSGL